jgi:Ca2+-binding RTX toxin-like protein
MRFRFFRFSVLASAAYAVLPLASALACPTAASCPVGYRVRDFSASAAPVTFASTSEAGGNTNSYCIIGSAFGDTLSGSNVADVICGGGGADSLDGRAGNDTLTGGDGDDTILTGSGTNTASGGSGNDTITGGSGVDTLSGDDGADIIDGAGSNDVLSGGLGDDSINGGAGGDTINGNEGNDTITDPSGTNTINGGDGNDILSGGSSIDTINGDDGNDTINGGNGNDVLSGGLGDDAINGGIGGNDTLNGGDGVDTLTDPSGTNTLNGGDGNDILTGGTGVDTISGGLGDDSITGNGSGDFLFGGDGADTIDAGSGNDNVSGEAGNDVINAGAGNDSVDGGADNDTITDPSGTNTLSGGAGIDTITGGTGADTINGDDGDDALNGGAGNDNISGGLGNDTIATGTGINTVNGGDGNDIITGNTGADTLNGDAGNDTIDAGAGNDNVSGGDGDDVILTGNGTNSANGGNGNDTITGGTGVDTVNGDAGNDTITGGDGNDVLSGGDNDDTIYGGNGADTISGNAGNDLLDGQAGNDTLNGGDGNDLLYGRTGTDTLNGGAGADYVDGGADGVADNLTGGTEADTCISNSGEESIVGGCENLTFAMLETMGAHVEDGRTVVRWSTFAEHGTIGFDLLRRDAPSAPWRRVNATLLTSVHVSEDGGAYAYADPAPASGGTEYRLVERDAFGRHANLGEAAVTGSGARSLGAQHTKLVGAYSVRAHRGAYRRAPAYARPTRLRALALTPTRAKAFVRERGIVRLSLADLALGLGATTDEAAAAVASGALALSAGGQPVAWTPLNEGDGIEFFGAPERTVYSDDNVYWLERGEGIALESIDGTPNESPAQPSFVAETRIETDTFPARAIPIDPENDPWFSHVISATIPGRETASITFDAEALVSGGAEAALSVELQGASRSALEKDHRVRVSLNGSDLGTAEWTAYERAVAHFNVPPGLLRAEGNELVLSSVLPEGAEANIAYLDGVTVSYPRTFEATDDALEFVANADGPVEITGLTSDAVRVLRVSDALPHAQITGAEVTEFESGFRVRFNAIEGERYFVAARATAPREFRADSASGWRTAAIDADYVVITRDDMLGAAEELAAHRRSQGLRTAVIDIEDIYDEWNHGVASPRAITAMLAYAQGKWARAPRYVVLAGAGHYDYRDLRALGGNVVPPLEVMTSVGMAASDSALADTDGDGRADFAIGRLPVTSPEQLELVVDKLKAFDSVIDAASAGSLFVSDQTDGISDFAADSALTQGALPGFAGAESIVFDGSETSEARSALISAFEADRSWINYAGHGSSDRWSRSEVPLMAAADVPGLGANPRPPLLTAMTCLTNAFDVPGTSSLGAELLLHPSGGAIAVVGATASTAHDESMRMLAAFGEEAAASDDHRAGDLLLGAYRRYDASRVSTDSNTTAVYALLGDPATQVSFSDEPAPGTNASGPSCAVAVPAGGATGPGLAAAFVLALAIGLRRRPRR